MSEMEQASVKSEFDLYPEVEVLYADAQTQYDNNFCENIIEKKSLDIVIKEEKDDGEDDMEICSVNTHETPPTSKPARQFSCHICGANFAKISEITDHVSKHSRRTYPCQHCTCIFVHESDYDVHQLVHNPDPNVTVQLFICEFCGEKYPNQVLLDAHKIEHKDTANKNGLPCDICGMKLKTSYTLKIHMKKHLIVEPLTCAECGKQYTSHWTFRQHERLHTVEGLPCPLCDKRFLSRSKLNSHLITHNAVKPFQCKLCNKKFARRNSLQVHMRIHTGQKKPFCKTCKKSFNTSEEVVSHMVVHKTDMSKPFKCSDCDSEFLRPGQLRNHYVNMHTTDTPFACEICNDKFKTKKVWKYHTVTKHSEVKPFKCGICSKGFLIKYLLDRHVKTHSDERPWPCEYCDKKFKLKKTLIVHMGYFHKDKLPPKKPKGAKKER